MSRPSCAIVGKIAQGRLDITRSPTLLSECLSPARTHKITLVSDAPPEKVMEDKDSFDPVWFCAKRI